jgi:threonine/homoserine/homoserine lactone efflux protein
MTGLVIFTVMAMAGCAFLIYFMFALWRDSRSSRRVQRVEIRRLPSPRMDKGKLLHLYRGEDLRAREKKQL